jgi:hypothetical protein
LCKHDPRTQRYQNPLLSVPALEVCPFFLGPVFGESAKIEAPADDQLTLAENLRFPAVALTVEAKLTAPRDVLVSQVPERLAWRRLPGRWGQSVGAVEGVVGHPDTIPRGVTGRVRAGRFLCRRCRLSQGQALPRAIVDTSIRCDQL